MDKLKIRNVEDIDDKNFKTLRAVVEELRKWKKEFRKENLIVKGINSL